MATRENREQSEFQHLIKVIIADHQAVFRAGIVKTLAVEGDIRIVGQPHSIGQLLNALGKLWPRAVILSTWFLPQLPEIHEIASARNIALLMLVENSDTASDFIRMGVQGVIYRCAGGDVVVEAVRQLSRGESFLQKPNTKGELSDDLVGARVLDFLSERDLHIISAVVKGHRNRDIASQLHISEQVVKKALRSIFDKTSTSDRLHLALFTKHHRALSRATVRFNRHRHREQ